MIYIVASVRGIQTAKTDMCSIISVIQHQIVHHNKQVFTIFKIETEKKSYKSFIMFTATVHI